MPQAPVVRLKQHRRSSAVALPALLALAACGRSGPPGTPGFTNAPSDRPSVRETAQCHADLRTEGVAFRILPDKDYGAGCAITGAVQLTDIGVPVTGVTAMRCGTARAFAAWVRNGVAPAAYQMLGSEIASVQGYGTYACRNVVGSARAGSRLSGHAQANAVDVGGVRLKDGRRITLLSDWNGQDERTREFLRTIRKSACRRFGTVLSPDYNQAHRDHFHLEDDRAGFCR